jgi:hypothetical protein
MDLLTSFSVASARIAAKVGDAHAHAAKAITDAARHLADGRVTRARLNASPSRAAAVTRLDELLDDLVAIVRRARAALYHEAFTRMAGQIPEAYLARANPEPTQRDTARFVAALLHGADLRDVLRRPVRTAQAQLTPMLTQACRHSEDEASAADRLDAWQRRASSTIATAMRLALSDSAAAAPMEATRDLLDPALIDDTPLEAR